MKIKLAKFLLYFSWFQLVIVSGMWAAAFMGLIAKGEPQVVLHLSFFAIWQGALVAVISAIVNKDQEEMKE